MSERVLDQHKALTLHVNLQRCICICIFY